MKETLAKIERTALGVEDHGIFTAMLHCSYGHSGQGVGGYTLDQPRRDIDDKFIGRFGTAYGMEFIRRVLLACGVDSWEKLPGRTIFVYHEADSWNSPVVGIGPLPTEKGTRFMFDDIKDFTDAFIDVDAMGGSR